MNDLQLLKEQYQEQGKCGEYDRGRSRFSYRGVLCGDPVKENGMCGKHAGIVKRAATKRAKDEAQRVIWDQERAARRIVEAELTELGQALMTATGLGWEQLRTNGRDYFVLSPNEARKLLP